MTLSSTVPTDFPLSALRLPRTAFGDDFDLLASRARCKGNLLSRRVLDQGTVATKIRSEREILYAGTTSRGSTSSSAAAEARVQGLRPEVNGPLGPLKVSEAV